MENFSERLFIVLAGTETKKYTFDIATEEEIAESNVLIKIIEVDNSCTGNEAVEMCYGIDCHFFSENIGNIPSFFMPLQEMETPEIFIDNINSVLGHIKYCLSYCIVMIQNAASKKEIEQLRHEAIGNFRVKKPISL